MKNEYDICIIGCGPAAIGMISKFMMNNFGKSIICIDAGAEIIDRKCRYLENKECISCDRCNMIHGVGGCALLSSGKISNYPAGSKLKDILGGEEETKKILNDSIKMIQKELPLKLVEINPNVTKEMKELFYTNDIIFKYYDVYKFSHSNLKQALNKLKIQALEYGIDFLTKELVIDIVKGNTFFEVITESHRIKANKVVLAVGKTGSSLLKRTQTLTYLDAEDNTIDIGVRFELPDKYINKLEKIHGDIKLKYKNIRTYCYSSRGKVASYKLNNHSFTEGFSDIELDTNRTNFALLLRVDSSESVYKSILEWYNNRKSSNIYQSNLIDFLNDNKNFMSEILTDTYIEELKEVINIFLKKILDYDDYKNIEVFGPEMDIVAKKFQCDSNFSVNTNLYMIGACLGQFRGILQAYTSGVKCADHIMEEI